MSDLYAAALKSIDLFVASLRIERGSVGTCPRCVLEARRPTYRVTIWSHSSVSGKTPADNLLMQGILMGSRNGGVEGVEKDVVEEVKQGRIEGRKRGEVE